MTARIFFRTDFLSDVQSPLPFLRHLLYSGQLPLTILIFLLTLKFSYSQSAANERILFVGNSYTYFWNLPQQVSAMGVASDNRLKTRQSTSGGANLGHHWRGDLDLRTREIIKRGEYDAIIFQGHSMSTISFPDSLLHYADRLCSEIPSDSIKRYVYMTWAREWNPIMQDTIAAGYEALAKKIDAEVIPVGLAWALARQYRPDIELYDTDGSHPSTLGSYLSACVIYGVLADRSPLGLPNRLMTTDRDGEVLYLNIQSKEDAEFCQRIVQSTLRKYEQK